MQSYNSLMCIHPQIFQNQDDIIDGGEVIFTPNFYAVVTIVPFDRGGSVAFVKCPQLPNIYNTSDPHWSAEIQKNWPSYFMGASSVLLKPIEG